MIDWKRKLTSRKFWAAVVGVVGAVLVALGKSESEITQVTAIITAGATLIAYIIGEGMVDAAREKEPNTQAELVGVDSEIVMAEPSYDMDGEGL